MILKYQQKNFWMRILNFSGDISNKMINSFKTFINLLQKQSKCFSFENNNELTHLFLRYFLIFLHFVFYILF